MTVSQKFTTIDSKIEQNKALWDLERQTAKISALSSGNVGKYKFLTGKDIFSEKDLLEKAATMKRFEYSLLVNDFKKHTGIVEKQYKSLDKDYELVKNGYERIKREKPTVEKYSISNLVYNS